MDFVKQQDDKLNAAPKHDIVQNLEMHQQEASLHREARLMMAEPTTANAGRRSHLPFGSNKSY